MKQIFIIHGASQRRRLNLDTDLRALQCHVTVLTNMDRALRSPGYLLIRGSLLCSSSRPRPPQHRRAQVLKEGGDDDDMPAFMPFATAHFSYGRSSFVDPAAPDVTNDDCLLYNSQARAPAARCRTRAAPRPSPAYCAGRPHPELLRSALSLAHPHMSWYG